MEQLKIGDKLYYKEYNRWNESHSYKFASVERLTKTQAILSDGTKLINTPFKDYHNDETCFSLYGDRYKKWYFENEEILQEAKKEREKQRIEKWFRDKNFTFEEKVLVYKTLVSEARS